MSKVYYPEDQIASITTMFTGYGPSNHGIVNRQWSNGEDNGIVQAYAGMECRSQVAHLADVVDQAFGEQSLIVSASYNFQSTSALTLNQYATTTRNTFGFYWNDKVQTYQNAFSNIMSSVMTDRDSVRDYLSKKSFALRSKGDKITYDKENDQVNVYFNGDQIQFSFSLQNIDDFNFFSEIAMIDSISQALQTSTFRNLIIDSIPDLFSFSFSTVKTFKSDVNKFKAAMLLLDGTLSQLINDYQTLYEGRIAVEIAFMGETAYESIHNANLNSKLKVDTFNKISAFILNKQLFDESFPVIYVREGIAQSSCQSLKQLSNDQQLELECPVKETFIGDFNDKASAGFVEVSTDVAIFQIVLWFSIILVFTLLAALYALFSMDVGHQTNQFMLPAKTK